MVLKNDDHTGDFCQEVDASEDSSCNVLLSEWRQDQKGLVQNNDGSSISRRVDEAKEDFCTGTNKDDRSGSCEAALVNSFGQGVETVNLKTKPRSPSLGYDMEDTHIDTRKHSQVLEATVHRSSMSPRDNCQGQKVMQTNEVIESAEKCESSLQTSLGNDADESDVEEEDVKVCDICGDAGREDLLAVCARCSDGAEHTYCMREMLDKVPEGDWFCEECKLNELEARRQEHLKLVGGIERSKSLGRTSSVNSDIPFKLDKKDSVCEPSKAKIFSLSKQLSSKRSGDIIEAGPAAKKQVLESSSGSPTASSPSQVPMLSKDCSFKNLDKTKGKKTNQCSTGTESAGDSSENTHSPTKNPPNNLKGNYVKSNSFGSSNSKPNVKLSEEVVQKQKQSSVDAVDGPGKLIGKSMSFKGLGRSSVGEPKVKMLSPKCAPIQELKGHKQVRERSSFERKNTIKLDSIPVQPSANSTKRVPRVDSTSTLSISSSRDYKNAQSDGKLTALSKQALVNKSPDAVPGLGEAKRLSSINSRGAGASSSAEAKTNHISSKDGPILNSSRAADGSPVFNGVKVDVNDNLSEKSLENNFGRSRQGVNGALVSGNRRGLSSDASISRVKEGIREENKLKAAIEAAMQKKQHMFKKSKIPEKPSELSMSITQGIHAGDTISNQAIDSIPEDTVNWRDAGLSNHISNSCKYTSTGSAKQFKVYSADFVVNSEEESIPSVSAIPEQEAVWQGGFEIHRNGKVPDVCGGFQAHLSSFASGKVLEVVKKLPPKIVLSEISRPYAWPFQFKEAVAQEDNIALYFFAKDIDSYLRSYKILLEYMMKHDLAFRGNINGFELLVFPSNHLSYKSQRWNTLFFMWGVFRGRRARCPEERCASLERPEIPVSISNTVPRVKIVAEAAAEDLSISGSDTVVSRCEIPNSEGPSLEKSGSLSNGDYYDQGCNVGRTCLSSPTSQRNLEKSRESYSPVLGAESCSELGAATLEDHCQLDPKIVVQHQHSTQEVDSVNIIHESKKSLRDPVLEKRNISSCSSEVPTVKQEGSVIITGKQVPCTVNNNVVDNPANSLKQEDQCVDNTQKNGDQVKPEIMVEQEEDNKDSTWKMDGEKLKWEGSLKREGCVDINVSADDSMEDIHSLPCSPKRPSAGDLNEPTSEAASAIPCQKRPWVDNKNLCKDGDQTYVGERIKGADSFYGCDLRRFTSSLGDKSAAEMHDVSTSSRIEDATNEAVDEKLTSVNPGSSERCFFLVDPHAAQSVLSEDHPSPWKASLLGNENRLPDGSPDLELALGVEKKQSRKEVLPFFAGIVDKKGPDRPPDITSPKEVDETASASLSLSLAFPFSDQENSTRPEKPLTTVEQALPARHEANTPLLLFRGSSGK